MTTFASTVFNADLNGLFGLWVFIETQPGYQAGGALVTGSITVELSTDGAFGNHLAVTFAPNTIKEGWNFLKFRMRNFQAYVTDSGIEEHHPHGVLAVSIGTGAGANILANPINKIRIIAKGAGITGTNFYLDSLWTGFDTQAQFVMGYDTSDQSIIDHALPIFQQYGWKGYITINGGYWDGVASRIVSDYTRNTGSYPGRIEVFKNAGWDTINHGLQHLPGLAAGPTMRDLTNAAEIAYEVMANYGIMRSLGLSRGLEFYAAPQNSSSRLSEKVIAECGFKIQRCSRGKSNSVTPWGVPNLRHLGSLGLGATGGNVYQSTAGNISGAVMFGSGGIGNLQKSKNALDVAIAYGDTFIAYAHNLETVGDDGTGNSTPAESANCIESLNRLFLAYAKTKEDAGALRVCDGFSGFYYGIGR